MKVTLLNTTLDKSLGLLRFQKATPVLLFTRFGIHTFGMKYPIDVIVLSKDNTVVRLKKQLHPNTIFLWPLHFNKVLELPAGYINKKHITIGKTLKLLIEKKHMHP